MKQYELNLTNSEKRKLKLLIYFKNHVTILGLIFTLISGAVCVPQLLSFTQESFIRENNYLVWSQGVIKKVNTTIYSVGDAGSDAKQIKEYVYEYQVGNDKMEGSVYSHKSGLKEGDSVKIHTHKNDPHKSIIKGYRKSPFPNWVLITVIIPSIGLFFVFKGTKSGKRMVDILNKGVLTEGNYKKSERKSYKINDLPMFEHQYQYTEIGGMTFQCIVENSEENPEEIIGIIYNRENPLESFSLYDCSVSGLENKLFEKNPQ